MRVRLALLVCLAVASLFLSLMAQEMSSPKEVNANPSESGRNIHSKKGKSVKVVLLKSWGVGSVWADLKINWNDYGNTPLVIDDTSFVNSDFTYQDLVRSKADVIVISNAAGGNQAYSQAEAAAVAAYTAKGHSATGTYEVFQYSTTDNRALAPVFGLDPTLEYTHAQISNLFYKVKSEECLFTRISGNSWQSYGYDYSQVPASGSWSGNLDHATSVAESDSYVGVITLYQSRRYVGVYVSNFPEYYGGADDEQLLYNACTCYVK